MDGRDKNTMHTKPNILIVDDQPEYREILRIALNEKYAVATACDAENAFKYMSDYPVDLVVLDYRMPKIDGLTALREIKKRHPDTKVIMMTGYAPLDTIQNSLRLGVSAFFMKPFVIDKLLYTIDEALQTGTSGKGRDNKGSTEYKISSDVLKATNKCRENFSCLTGIKDCLCEVTRYVDKGVLFINPPEHKSCNYMTLFGHSYLCNCPTRNEIYRVYRK